MHAQTIPLIFQSKPMTPLQIVQGCSLFNGLNEQQLRGIVQTAVLRRIEPRVLLFDQDEPATTFYVLLSGKVRLTQLTPEGHHIIVSYIGAGGGIGIIAALGNSRYPLAAEGVEAGELFAWSGEVTGELMLQCAPFAVNALRLILARFQELQDRYRELATERVERRIAHALLRLMKQMGVKGEDGVLIDMPLSRQDLAEMTGTTLYTVSRTLRQWEGAGIVKIGRQWVIVKFPHGLVKIAEDL